MAKPLLSDELWKLIEPYIPVKSRRRTHPGRRAFAALSYMPIGRRIQGRLAKTLRDVGVRPCISGRNRKHGRGLETHRWVAEHPLSWLHQFRHLRLRYERCHDVR
jgi:transposase